MQYLHMFQYHVTHIHRSRPGMYIQLLNHNFFLPLSAESRLRRPVDASNTHTSDIKTGDGTTWWRPFSPADIGKSRFRRIAGAGNTLARTGEAGDAYTLVNYLTDFTTWRHLFPLSKLAKSQLRRLMRAGNTPTRFGYAGDAYTLFNDSADGTTWRRPFSLSNWQKFGHFGSWEPATRRRDSATPVTRTPWLMKQSTTQHGGARE